MFLLTEPEVFLLPDQSPEAVQSVASVVLQSSVVEPFCDTVLGVAEKESVGGAGATVTVAESLAEPPGPVQVSV